MWIYLSIYLSICIFYRNFNISTRKFPNSKIIVYGYHSFSPPLSLSLSFYLSFFLSLFLSFSLSFFLSLFLSSFHSFVLPFFLSFFLHISFHCSIFFYGLLSHDCLHFLLSSAASIFTFFFYNIFIHSSIAILRCFDIVFFFINSYSFPRLLSYILYLSCDFLYYILLFISSSITLIFLKTFICSLFEIHCRFAQSYVFLYIFNL
ncbi:unnamed protein product [Acanthosepion pharaonis]|uniref:Uncharacterized protein n=1 Tax=Acanthosepion pharaonis TaxID=158019 RepID=A0A812DJH6_ACAPH|nr:unnamed protein product [Sepia pharaonis]